MSYTSKKDSIHNICKSLSEEAVAVIRLSYRIEDAKNNPTMAEHNQYMSMRSQSVENIQALAEILETLINS